MKLFTKQIMVRLLANGQVTRDGATGFDPMPVVKLFTPDGNATWLLTEIDPQDTDIAFGLCDLGFGTPELGVVSITELMSVRGRLGLRVERDRAWTAKKTLSQYAEESARQGRIVA